MNRQKTPLSRVWFLSRGCKQVPPESTGGKVLWAHPDGYFLNAKGQKLKHSFNPAKQRGIKNANNTGSCYPTMRQFGSKNCHHLMYEAFYGPRTKGMEIDHINGDKLDYRPSNLEEVFPAENRRRANILRAMRAAKLDPRTYSSDELLDIFKNYNVGDPLARMEYDMTHHCEC